MDIQEREALEIELKNNTEVITHTFEQYNINVLSVAYHWDSERQMMKIWVELAAISGYEIKYPGDFCIKPSLNLKINFYNDRQLICSEEETIWEFLGYDTIEFRVYYENLLNKATMARLFATMD